MPLSNRMGKCAPCGPTPRQPVCKKATRDTEFSSPLGQRQTKSVEFDCDVVASIVSLLRSRCPSAISRLVVALIVHAIQCMEHGWAKSHVSDKIQNASPLTAHDDAASAVIFITPISRVVATLIHRIPRLVGGSLSQSVDGMSGRRSLPQQATTAPCVSGNEGIDANSQARATVAKANIFTLRYSLFGNEASEAMADSVFKWRHGRKYSNVYVDGATFGF